MNAQFEQYQSLLTRYLRPQWSWVLMLTVLLFGNIGLQLVNPQLVRRFIDTAMGTLQTSDASQTLLRTALLFIGVALAQQVVAVLVTYVSENVSWRATNALRVDLIEHCLRLDMSFHNTRTPGEMIERIDGDVTALHNFFSQFVIQVLGSVLLLVGVLAMLFGEDWRTGLVFTGFILLTLLALGWLRNIAIPHWMAARQAYAKQFGFLEERLSGTEDIRSCGAKAYVMRCFYRLVRKLKNKVLKAGLMVNILMNAVWVSFTLGNAVALALAAYLFQQEAITIGSAYLIFYYSNMLSWPIQQIMQQAQDLQQAGAGIMRVEELLNTPSKIRDDDGVLDSAWSSGSVLPQKALGVAFQDVSFGYAATQQMLAAGQSELSKEMVLRNLSFQLQPGTVLGLLGRTGSGKTTLTRLLFRLYDPDEGRICLSFDGVARTDVRHLSLRQLRKRVGLVTQEVQLFHATVRDNLTFFNPGVSDEQILQAFHELGLWEWYQSLSEGLDTMLESDGGGLSAGEAQLLAFTRVFLTDPGLIILDEASSRLDPATECLIERAVDKLLQNRTAIIVAHRLGTVRRADKIMILEDGRICEYGARSALANDLNSRFYALLQTGLEEILV